MKNRVDTGTLVAVMAMLAMAGAAGAQSLDAEVRLEGSGKHRDTCNTLQLKPFDAALWGSLSDWSGTPVTAESAAGKVVLIMTWTSYAKGTNSPAAKLAQRLHERYADKGLLVVGVHNPNEVARAAAAAQELKLTFPCAADPKPGKFRMALHVDQDPDFYVIDRAGNMRFADIENSSVERAVEIALGETVEQASAVPGIVADGIRAAELEKMRIRDVAGVVKPGQPLTVTFNPPSEEEYGRARWPAVVTKTGVGQYDTMAERVRKERPNLVLNEETWVTPRPVNTGRVTLVYTIDILDEQIKPIATRMSSLQRAYPRDLVVVATQAKAPDESNLTDAEKQERAQARQRAARDFVTTSGLNHGFNTTLVGLGDNSEIVSIFALRHENTTAFLVSSDGRVRWCGNPYWDGFEKNVDLFIEADPGVKARRAAEAAAARSGAGN